MKETIKNIRKVYQYGKEYKKKSYRNDICSY